MGRTSTQAKQQWNAERYRQVKVSVAPRVAAAFKSACETANESMASVLSGFMSEYAQSVEDKKGYTPSLSTRRSRRRAVYTLIQQLERIRDNEELYRDNMPLNLQGSSRFEDAEQSLSLICEALESLESAY